MWGLGFATRHGVSAVLKHCGVDDKTADGIGRACGIGVTIATFDVPSALAESAEHIASSAADVTSSVGDFHDPGLTRKS
jgi:hypothetical protein